MGPRPPAQEHPALSPLSFPEGCCRCTYLWSLPGLLDGPWTCTVVFPPALSLEALSAAALDGTSWTDPRPRSPPCLVWGCQWSPLPPPQLCQPIQTLGTAGATVTSGSWCVPASGAALLVLLPGCSCAQQRRSYSIAKSDKKHGFGKLPHWNQFNACSSLLQTT